MTQRRLPKSTQFLLALLAGSLALFELLHRVIQVPQEASAIVLSLVFLPILVVGMIGTVLVVLADPVGFGHALRYMFAFLMLTVVFFAVLFAELGLVDSRSGVEVNDFWTGLYFSVSTLTTVGYGDFFPMPESRIVAAIEALAGYVLLSLAVATTFTYLTNRSAKDRR